MKRICRQAIEKPQIGNCVLVYFWWNDGTVTRQKHYYRPDGKIMLGLNENVPPIEWNNREFGPLIDTSTLKRIAE